MSVKHALLSLLEQEPMYGSQLRQEFEARTGGTWPLNVGQVYTTLTRLERDGLVAPAAHDEAAAPGLQVSDALWRGSDGHVAGTQDRDGLFRLGTRGAARAAVRCRLGRRIGEVEKGR